MAQRQRVRAAKARRRLERTEAATEVQAALARLARFATPEQFREEAAGVIEIVRAQRAARRRARQSRQVAARWIKASTTGWARGLSLGQKSANSSTAAHACAA